MMVDVFKEVGTLHWLREWLYISQKKGGERCGYRRQRPLPHRETEREPVNRRHFVPPF